MDNSWIYIPVELQVDNTNPFVGLTWPRTAGYPNSISFRNNNENYIFVGDTCIVSIDLWNIGVNSLIVNSIETSNQRFICQVDTTLLHSGECLPFEILFMPTERGNFRADLIVQSNDPENPETRVVMQASAVLPPQISTDAMELSIDSPEDGDSLRIRITNRGEYRLNWRAGFIWQGGDTLPDSLGGFRTHWIDVHPDSGTMFSFETRSIYLLFNNIDNHLPQEIGELFIESNDPVNPRLAIPLTITWLDVPNEEPKTPLTTEITAIYPNPCNSSTTIAFTVAGSETANLKVYNLSGMVIAGFSVSEVGCLNDGGHRIIWNAEGIPAGVYLVRLETPSGSLTQKILLLK